MYPIGDAGLDAYKSPARQITASIRYRSSVNNELVYLNPEDNLVNFTVERTSPTGKLFGFAVSQKITIEAVGSVTNLKKGTALTTTIQPKEVSDGMVVLPTFYVDTVEFNKVQNRTSIVGYDFLHKLDSIPIGEIEITYPTYALNYALDVVEPYGGYCEFEGLNHLIREAPNLGGSESARSVLTALAEFTGCICYVSYGNNIRFRPMKGEDFVDVLTADDYFDLTVGDEIVQLTMIGSVNEFDQDRYYYGDVGFTQVMRENPFFYNRTDTQSVIDQIANRVLSVQNVPYKLDWRGCPAYELGDLLILQDKDGNANYVRFFNETLIYDGGLKSKSEWESGESDSMDLNPQSVSSNFKQTIAKVDKINQEITLLAEKVENSDVGALTEEMASIKLTTDSITAQVSKLEEDIDACEQNIESVSAQMSSDNLSIIVRNEVNKLDIETDHVVTETGFTFDKDGMKITKTGNPISTTITENGMYVNDTGVDVLVANSAGVEADRLTAKTYLAIQDKVIFSEYGSRFGCFWIGG